jgi:hypothetical protein
VFEALSQFSVEPIAANSEYIRTRDGEAQIFGLGDADHGFMINHASGSVIWDALVHVADATGMAILPIGCDTCVTRAEVLEHLPEGLKANARVVDSGEQLVAAFN